MERVDYESLSIQDLLNFFADGNLDIHPWYQRRSVWSNPQRSYLINTIHENKPVPSIYIRHAIDIETEKSIKEVVDGQQRVSAIIAYKSDEFSSRHPSHERKVRYSGLNRNERAKFLLTKLSIGYLIGASEQDVIEIFGRINSVSKILNPQEKRNARFSGEFKQLCLRQAAIRLPFWRSARIFTASQISRMQEVQFISDLIVNMMEGLTDFSARKLDDSYERYDENFEKVEDIENRLESLFGKLIEIPAQSYSDTIFSVPQILFSLMVIIDAERRKRISSNGINEAIFKVDGFIGGIKGKDRLSDIENDFIFAFTSGNLHRIKARSLRGKLIREALL